jgi:hypothetical protein
MDVFSAGEIIKDQRILTCVTYNLFQVTVRTSFYDLLPSPFRVYYALRAKETTKPTGSLIIHVRIGHCPTVLTLIT